MATLFSDHYGTTSANTAFDVNFRPAAAIGHGRLRYKRAVITIPVGPSAGGAQNDINRLMTFKSGDRIVQLFHTATGGTAGAGNLGLYKSGANHDGALIDVDLFAATITVAGGVATADIFASGELEPEDRGKTLWECADEGAGTYTADPVENWDLCLTISTAITVTPVVYYVEAFYLAGD